MSTPVNCTRWLVGLTTNQVKTLNVTTLSDSPDVPVISDSVKDNINIYVNLLLRGSIALFGTATNIVNMLVFFKLGLKDSNGVGLMALAFSDFVVTFLGIAGTACFTWDTFFPDTVIDAVDFEFVTFGWVRDIAYLISGWITTLLSVERCVCVVSPFHVKQIFTRARSLVIIGIIYIVNIAVHIPVFLSQWLDWDVVECKEENGAVVIKERMVLHTSEDRHEIQIYIDIANGAVLPMPSQAIVVISVVWMIYGLHASSQIRKSVTKEERSNSVGGGSSKNKLSAKESRLVKVVMFLAIIFTICNVPRFLAVYAKQIFQEVSLGKKYSNLYVFLWNISALTGVINSSVNIFVYLIVNSIFREKCKELFGFGRKGIDEQPFQN